VYRIGVGKQFKNYLNEEGLWGLRTYGQFMVKEGFFLHGELEALRADSTLSRGSGEFIPPQLYGTNVGIGKSYSIGRRLNGNVVALYKVNFNGGIPHQSKFGIRIGFNFETKKQRNLAREIKRGRATLRTPGTSD
jgi:hypothetical protein